MRDPAGQGGQLFSSVMQRMAPEVPKRQPGHVVSWATGRFGTTPWLNK